LVVTYLLEEQRKIWLEVQNGDVIIDVLRMDRRWTTGLDQGTAEVILGGKRQAAICRD
jgi:hypothetical protein